VQRASVVEKMPHRRSSVEDLPPFPADLQTSPIAVISHKDLQDGNPEATKAALEACQTYGFFYLDLRTTPTGETLVDESEQLLQLSKEVFNMYTREEKMQYELKKGVSLFGYKAAGTIKKTDPTLRPDSTEFFNIGKSLAP
jgi:isopenicillin N synthase-like dioxygenase